MHAALARRGLCVDRVCAFSLQNFRAVALMHLYENPVQFGPTLSSLPHLLSRLRCVRAQAQLSPAQATCSGL